MKIKTAKIGVATTMIAIPLLLILMVNVRSSHAWFKTGNKETGEKAMGTVDVTVTDQTEVIDGTLAFTITNNSNIDTYMRLGWTPVIQGPDNTAKDVSGISIAKVEPADESHPDDLIFKARQIISRNKYVKNTILTEDNKGKYFVVPAHTDISGIITVTGWQGQQRETLHLFLIPEAIQATKQAVEAAETHGWRVTDVGAQAGTIIPISYNSNAEGGE